MPRKIYLSGVVGWEITAKGLRNKIDKKDKNTVFLDSVGGSVFEGNRLYNLLLDMIKDGVDIEFVLGAVAASAASYFPLAVGAENIKVRDNTVFMGHKAWSFAIGNADDMKSEAEILDGFDKMIAKAYSKVNGKPIDENLEAMGEEFWLMGGQAIVDAGFASGVVDPDESLEGDEPDETGKEKSEIQAMIKEAKAVLREKAEEEDLEQWAAKMREPVVNEKGQIEMFQNKEQSTPAESPGRNMSKETDMTFDEYLNQNPEHKTEFEQRIAAVEEKANAAVTDERKRVAELIGISGFNMNENIKAAIEDGTTKGEYAVAELDRRNKVVSSGEEQDLGELKVKNQVPEKVENEKESKAESVMDKAIDNIVGKDKKEGK